METNNRNIGCQTDLESPYIRRDTLVLVGLAAKE